MKQLSTHQGVPKTVLELPKSSTVIGEESLSNTGGKPHPNAMQGDRLDYYARRRHLMRLMKEVGPWNIDQEKEAQRWGVRKTIISRDIKKLIRALDSRNLAAMGKVLDIGCQKALRELQIGLNDPDAKVRIVAAKELLHGVLTYTDFLERWGMLEGIRDVNKQGSPTSMTYDQIRAYIQEGERLAKQELTVIESDNEGGIRP